LPRRHRPGAAQIEIEKLLIRKSHWDDHGLADYSTMCDVAGTSTCEIIAAGIAIRMRIQLIVEIYVALRCLNVKHS
jgi:hypothetical protein